MRGLSWKEAGKTALRIFVYQVIFGFVGFVFVPSLLGAPAVLRLVMVGALVLGALALVFVDGASRGEADSAVSDRLNKLRAKETYAASAEEEARRYAPLKGIISALLAALPLLLAAIYVAATAQPYAYTLQDLPAWMEPYTIRPEIGDALRYMQQTPSAATLTDYLRIGVRFLLFPFIGLFGTMTDAASLLFDRIGPLLALVIPAVSAIGYLTGPRRHARQVKYVNDVKSTPRKRLKKDRRQGQAKGPREKKQLV